MEGYGVLGNRQNSRARRQGPRSEGRRCMLERFGGFAKESPGPGNRSLEIRWD